MNFLGTQLIIVKEMSKKVFIFLFYTYMFHMCWARTRKLRDFNPKGESHMTMMKEVAIAFMDKGT